MGLVRAAHGGWQGVVTGRMYYPPRENKQSAESQEREYVKTNPFQLPKNVKPGSPEEALYKMQEEALSNYQRAELQDTILAYKAFLEMHPEYVGNDANAEQLSEYFHMKGVPFVEFNGAVVPLATSALQWEEAYNWKLAMGSLQVNPSTAEAQDRIKAQELARKAVLQQNVTEEELDQAAREEMSWRRPGGYL